MSTIPVFVCHGDGEPVIFRIPEDYYVGDLVDAVIEKLRLGVTADKVVLRFPPGGDGKLGIKLDSTASLANAGVRKECCLVVEVKSAPVNGEWGNNTLERPWLHLTSLSFPCHV